MTEQEWLACPEASLLLGHLGCKTTTRKLGLYGLACVRLPYWCDYLPNYSDWQAAVLAGEHLLDDPSAPFEPPPRHRRTGWPGSRVRDAQTAITLLLDNSLLRWPDIPPHLYLGFVCDAVEWVERAVAERDASSTLQEDLGTSAGRPEASPASLVLEVFGNPFRTSTLDQAWRNREVVAVAKAAYSERVGPRAWLDPCHLAVLADALEDAGCADAGLLAHLRGPGPHVRGCWALDLVLWKG